ncbi:MAG: translation elongation factor Ts [Alphaproteobacteria bacterium]
MVEINAKLVGELREKTGVGMMECKKALTACEGDLEKAIDFLRKKGVAMAEKKAGRVANQGLVAVAVEGNVGAVVELNSETDFVAQNADFQAFLKQVVDLALAQKITDIEALKNADLNGKTVQNTLVDLIAKIGENMSLRRVAIVAGDTVVPYVHSAIAPGLGKIGVLVSLKGENAAEIGKKVAMHVAASKPQFLSIADVDAATADHERGIYAEQARASGKPEAIIEKMVEGRMRKFYEETVLQEQAFIMDPDKKVKDILAENKAEVSTFVRFNLGEGIEKKQEDFAAEVAKQMG